MTLALAEVLRSAHSSGRPIRLIHRNTAPLFCGQPTQLQGHRTPRGVDIDLFGQAGPPGGPHTSLTIELQQESNSVA